VGAGARTQGRPRTGRVQRRRGQPETFRERFILGDLEHCIGEIEKYRREIGMDYLQCMMDFPDVDPELTKKSMRLFAREVMPYFGESR
jgi:hypothetical protein